MTSGSRWKRPKDTSQRTLFGGAPERRPSHPRVDPVATSRVALVAAQEGAPSMRDRILRYIADRREHGATYSEVCADLRLQPNSATPRLIELRRGGAIVRSGRARPTPSGHPAAVYVTPEYAPQEVH